MWSSAVRIGAPFGRRANGVELYLRSWRPETKARGTVVINHGFLSHSGRYEWPAAQLTRHGFAVYAHDMRGHGKSSAAWACTAVTVSARSAARGQAVGRERALT
jgi:alpha-beta hydrolase superfamily lysophospholipase